MVTTRTRPIFLLKLGHRLWDGVLDFTGREPCREVDRGQGNAAMQLIRWPKSCSRTAAQPPAEHGMRSHLAAVVVLPGSAGS
jgi:hypothetical protein